MTYFRNRSRWIHFSQKRASTSLPWRHFSKTWTSSQQKDLGFSRLGSRLLHWLWAYHIQLSAQIFYPDCRLFCLFQDFSPPQKVLHPKHSPCKPHAIIIWSKSLFLLKRLFRLAPAKPTTSESHSRGGGNSSMNLHSWQLQNRVEM